jgi:F-type H+-transporting ATPase subunit a
MLHTYSALDLVISSPLEQFEVVNLINLSAPLLGHSHLALTNLALYSLIVMFLVLGLHLVGNNEGKLIPSL